MRVLDENLERKKNYNNRHRSKNDIKMDTGSVLQPIEVKVKFTLEQATKAQRGSRGIALLFI
jgi:hypothetical protein